MTVGMKQMNQMFRDFKVAEDVARMMEMRRFAVEYTMYGTMFFQDEKKLYKISNSGEKIVDFMSKRKNFGSFPFGMISHTIKMVVPAGNEEDVTKLAKIKLAEVIKNNYSDEFIKSFLALAFTQPDNAAAEILDELQEKIDGLFRMDNIRLFEELLNIAYQAKHITEKQLLKYEEWLENQYNQMLGLPILTDSLTKELYGFAYQENGKIKALYSAEKCNMYKKMENKKVTLSSVSNIFSKKYGYNYDITLKDIRNAFGAYLLQIYDQQYFDYLNRIKYLPSKVSCDKFNTLMRKYMNDNNATLQTLNYYKWYWGV